MSKAALHTDTLTHILSHSDRLCVTPLLTPTSSYPGRRLYCPAARSHFVMSSSDSDSSDGCDKVVTWKDQIEAAASDAVREEKSSSVRENREERPETVADRPVERSTALNAHEDDDVGRSRATDSKADESPLAVPAPALKKEAPKVMLTPEGAIKETDESSGFVYYKCRFCGLTFNYLTTLKAHERVHNVEQPYVCPKCNCTFHYNCELEYHMQQHMGTLKHHLLLSKDKSDES